MAAKTTARRRLAVLAAGGLAAVAALLAATSARAAAPSACESAGAALDQFDVAVASREPLGLRLSERLEILEFVVAADGRARAVEASGLAEVGDRLLAVNGECVADARGGLAAAVEVLQRAERPMTLRFRARDGRQLVRDGADASGRAAPADGETAHVFDYVLLSDGESGADERLFAVLAGDGKPPSCGFRRLVVSRPLDACEPLANAADVADAYVLVPDLDACPAHQKALLAQEAGARGVVLVARDGKPRQVRLPPASELPTPLRLPVAMVSRDAGERARRRLASTPPSLVLNLAFVFSAACADDKYAPLALTDEGEFEDEGESEGGDPRRRPIAAGFLSVSVAASASSVLAASTFEFLRPRASRRPRRPAPRGASAAARLLPVGRRDLFLADDASVFRPCETDASRASPLLRLMRTRREFHGKVALAPLLGSALPGAADSDARQCSLRAQLAFYSALGFEAVILCDAAFPAAAHSPNAAAAAADRSGASLPFVFVSRDAYLAIRRALAPSARHERHVQVELTGENALHHQWQELAHLAEPSNWPAAAAVRERLLHRMLKDHDAVVDQRAHLALAANERRGALLAAYEAAHQFHREQLEQRQRRLEDAPPANEVSASVSAAGGSTITMVYHERDGGAASRYTAASHG